MLSDSNQTSPAVRVLVVDDDPISRQTLGRALQQDGKQVIECEHAQQLLDMIDESVDAILLDLYMPIVDSLACLDRLRAAGHDRPVIVVTSDSDSTVTINALKHGAFDTLAKPVDVEELLSVVNKAIRITEIQRENQLLRRALSEPVHEVDWIGDSPQSQTVLAAIEHFSQRNHPVLITGEGGTGHSLAARLIHKQGPRAAHPLMRLNSRYLPAEQIESELFGWHGGPDQSRPGRIELASHGSLYIDEVADLPPDVQQQLTRWLGQPASERHDARLIVATRYDLAQLASRNRFRPDLLSYLESHTLNLPSLRERVADVPLLVRNLLAQIARGCKTGSFQIANEAKSSLIAYSWPGNVRELRKTLEQATAVCRNGVIQLEDLPSKLQNPSEAGAIAEEAENQAMQLAGMTLKEIERLAIEHTLEYCKGNKARAARELGISEKSIYNKMDRLGMDRKVRS